MRGGCKRNLGKLNHGVCHASQWLFEKQEECFGGEARFGLDHIEFKLLDYTKRWMVESSPA